MSKGRQLYNMASSLLGHACRSGQTFGAPAQLRRVPEPCISGVRCMATKAAAKKSEADPVTKAALVELMAERGLFETKAAADSAVSAVIETIMDQVIEGKTVRFVGFGSFQNRPRAARKGRNPATGAEMDYPATNLPGFTAGKTFKDSVKAGKRMETTKKAGGGRKKKTAS